jgi:hypothetical protein
MASDNDRAPKKRAMKWGILVILFGMVFFSGCNDQVNQTHIETGTGTPDLLMDMQYEPIDLPSTVPSGIPAGLLLRNNSVGTLKDGNLLFSGELKNEETATIPGYIIVTLEVLGNDSKVLKTSHPLASDRDLPSHGTFRYFYVTTEPLNRTVTSYRILIQIADRYPGV